MISCSDLKIGSCNRPHFLEVQSGDLPFFQVHENKLLLGLIDGLGHGNPAHQIAQLARKSIEGSLCFDLKNLFQKLDEALSSSKGAAIALAVIDFQKASLQFAGIGNVAGYLIGHIDRQFVSVDGIVGRPHRSLLIQEEHIKENDLIILTSDGIKSRFYVKRKEGLFTGSPIQMANRVIHHYGKMQDDASCLVLQCELWNV